MTYDELNQSSLRNNENNDCTVIALSVATGLSYEKCHRAMKQAGRKDGRGASLFQMKRAAKKLGFHMINIPTFYKKIKSENNNHRPSNRTIERWLSQDGHFILSYCDHVAGVRDGKVIDHTAGRKNVVEKIFVVLLTGQIQHYRS